MSAEAAMHCDGLGADPAPGGARIIFNPDPAPGEEYTPCHYSPLHNMQGKPATCAVDMPALRDQFPQGVPMCDACREFYGDGA